MMFLMMLRLQFVLCAALSLKLLNTFIEYLQKNIVELIQVHLCRKWDVCMFQHHRWVLETGYAGRPWKMAVRIGLEYLQFNWISQFEGKEHQTINLMLRMTEYIWNWEHMRKHWHQSGSNQSDSDCFLNFNG